MLSGSLTLPRGRPPLLPSGRCSRLPSPHPTAPQQPRECPTLVLSATAQRSAYVTPSSSTAATELEVLERFSVTVPDLLLMENLQQIEQPKAATVSSGVLNGLLNNTVGLTEYKIAVQNALQYDKCLVGDGSARNACQIDKALVNVGSLFAKQVEGRVSTEVDPRLSFDTNALVQRGRSLAELYEETGLPKDKYLLRLPATWEAIQAAKVLEDEGIATHVIMVYSFVQAAAAAQAGVSVIQPNVGRIHAWYDKHPGIIRNPKGPREDAGAPSAANPGTQLVQKMYNYIKRYHPKTKVMAAGIRHKEDAFELAGVDYLVVSPQVLASLNDSVTIQGYNDGLSAASEQFDLSFERKLSEESASKADFSNSELSPVTEASFRAELDKAGLELLTQGVDSLVGNVERLEGSLVGTVSGGNV